MRNVEVIKLEEKFDKDSLFDGSLVSFQVSDRKLDCFKRIYSIYGAKKNTIRGNHSHKHLNQFLICIYGAIKIKLFDGYEHQEFTLNKSNIVLYVGPMIWRTMEWIEDDSVLLVIASEEFDESDYIRNYDVFLRIIHND